jgi:hypothetical protein
MKTVLAFLMLGGLPLPGQDMQFCPMHKEHMKEASQHQTDVEKHGDERWDFPMTRPLIICVCTRTAEPSKWPWTTARIPEYAGYPVASDAPRHDVLERGILHSIFVHDQVPPGVPVMKGKHEDISYTFEELPSGGRVRIKTTNTDALKAIHQFLRFQIEDNHTGDTTEIERASLGRNLYQLEFPLLQFIHGAGTAALGWCLLAAHFWTAI